MRIKGTFQFLDNFSTILNNMKSLKILSTLIYFIFLNHNFTLKFVQSHFIEEITDPYVPSTYSIISHVPILHVHTIRSQENNPIGVINSQPKSNGDGDTNSSPIMKIGSDRNPSVGTTQEVETNNSGENEVPIIRSATFDPPKMSEKMKLDHYKEIEVTQVQCIDPEGKIGICQSHAYCASYYIQFLLTNNMKNANCKMANGQNGVCCQPVVAQQKVSPIMEPRKVDKYISDNSFNELDENMENVVGFFRSAISKAEETERTLLQNPENIIERRTASHGHLQFFMTTRKALSLAKTGLGLLETTRNVKAKMDIDDEMAGNGLRNIRLINSSAKKQCVPRGICDPYYNYYRTLDGSCNNLNKSEMGMAFTPLYRILPPTYIDGLYSPRASVLGRKLHLPKVRQLSTTITTDQNYPHEFFSLWVMQFGQFLAHDLSHVPIHRYENLSGVECCWKDGRAPLPPQTRHPQCLPIEIPRDDPFYRAYRQRCMNFVRSMVGPRTDCSLGHADQLNQITSHLDNSNVYGSGSEEESKLRMYKDGLLKPGPSLNVLNGNMLPTAERPGDECTHPDNNTYCYNAGDLRVNEMIGLTATHVIFFREHNRIAKILKSLNPNWSDNILYYEARRILNAQYQHIVYNEWLPMFIGRKFMQTYGILTLSEGYAKDYDPRIDPSVSNAFAAAAYRVGHSLIQGLITLSHDIDSSEDDIYLIHEHFNNPFALEKIGMLDKILQSLGTNPIQKFDSHVTNEVTNRLFQPLNSHYGMDLVSLNLQRGRDHGLPSYNEFRKICGLGKAKTFDDLLHHMPAKKVNQLRRAYKDVNDIDLFLGGLCENPLSGALLGPTFVCIVGDQFARSKRGDRFAYDLGNLEHSFTPTQLSEIRKASMARFICDNSDSIKTVQPLAFYLPNAAYNPLVECDSPLIAKPDFTYWRQY